MAPYDETMLFYAWHFWLKKAKKENKSPFEMKRGLCNDEPGLWETMMKTYENILSDTSNKKGWKWLKRFFVTSCIWFLPNPNYNKQNETKEEEKESENDNEYNKMENGL
eukprot:273105_1